MNNVISLEDKRAVKAWVGEFIKRRQGLSKVPGVFHYKEGSAFYAAVPTGDVEAFKRHMESKLPSNVKIERLNKTITGITVLFRISGE